MCRRGETVRPYNGYATPYDAVEYSMAGKGAHNHSLNRKITEEKKQNKKCWESYRLHITVILGWQGFEAIFSYLHFLSFP